MQMQWTSMIMISLQEADRECPSEYDMRALENRLTRCSLDSIDSRGHEDTESDIFPPDENDMLQEQ